MALAHKVTITLPDPTFQAVDRLSASTGTTRSGLIARAIDDYIARAAELAAEEKWVRSYQEYPQEISELALELMAERADADEDW